MSTPRAKPKYYLTTPLYYTNGMPHIGHTYSTIVADVIRRYKRMRGFDVFMTTGADEHGVNVERSAQKAGKSPQEFSTEIAVQWRRLWDDLGIAGDEFIRTTDEKHHRTVQWLFKRCRENGFIEKGHYTGQYCVHDNAYVLDAGPGDACPDCGRPTETVTEENYFFKLSRFHSAGEPPERGSELREWRPEKSFDNADDDPVGNSGAGRSAACILRVV